MATRIDRPTPTTTTAPRPARPTIGAMPTAQLPGALQRPQKLTLTPHANGGAQRAHVVAEVPLQTPTSGLVLLPTGEVLVANDNNGIEQVNPFATNTEKPKTLVALRDVEALTLSSDGKRLYACEERTRRVHRYDVRSTAQGLTLVHAGAAGTTLPNIAEDPNTGWEGLSFLDKRIVGLDSDVLVAVHEHSPRRVGFFRLPNLDADTILKLPKNAKDLLPDLADVAVDPKTGHLFIVSDQAGCVCEFELCKQTGALLNGLSLKLLSSVDLNIGGSRKAEALHFDASGRLWVGLDDENDNAKKGQALVLSFA